jgi:hypothetical protein
MKTTTYLRWSLLIPFVVWGLCLLVFLLISKLPVSDNFMDPIESMSVMDAFSIFLAFYLFGVIVWIFPYLLLALTLFFWSFIGKAQTMIKAFALSPLAMTLLTVAIMIILELGGNWGAGFDSNWGGPSLLFAGVALVWGYICVGIGYGLYRFLKRREIIRDEEVLPAPQSV